MTRTAAFATAGCLALAVARCSPSSSSDLAPYPGTRVWRGEGPDFYTGDVSPDGRYFTDINWDTGDLDLVDLVSGESTPLTGRGYDGNRYAWSSAFSSDGRRVAVEWYRYDTGTHELRIEAVDGNSSRLLVPASENRLYLEPLDWSPSDAEILVALRGFEDDWQLGLVSTADGSIDVLKTLDWQTPGGLHPQAYPYAAWSADGRWIAYDYPSGLAVNDRDIYLLAADGTRESVLVEGPGHHRVAAWSPSGRDLLYYSDRSGSASLWRLSVSDDGQAGDSVLVASNLRGIKPLGWTLGGFAYGVADGTWNTYLAAIDAQSGKVVEPPRPVDDVAWQRNALGDWSADGRRLMHVTFRPLPDSRETATFLTTSGGPAPPVSFPAEFHNNTGKVTRVGEATFLVNGTLRNESGFYHFDAESGTLVPLADFGDRGVFSMAEASPDGSEAYVAILNPEPFVIAIDVETGRQRPVVEAPLNPMTLAVSPDGGQLAYLAQAGTEGEVTLEIVDAAGGQARVARREPVGRLLPPLAWLADGSRLLVGVSLGDGQSGLWSIAPDGSGAPVFIDLPAAVGSWLRLSPAGEWIAFQSGVAMGSIWMLDLSE